MKELSIEEKAKAYDVALELMKDCIPDENGLVHISPSDIFPELKKSEDEVVGNAIAKCLACGVQHHIIESDMNVRCLAWLEQGEQKPKFRVGDTIKKKSTGDIVTVSEIDLKNREYRLSNTGFIPFKYEHLWEKPTDKVEPKFRDGDWVVNKFGDVWHIDSSDKKNYQVSNGNIIYNYFPISKQNEMHLWTIQDAKDGDVLCDYCEGYDNPLIFILKKFERVDFGLVKPSDYSSYCFLTAGDRQIFKEGKYHHKHNIKPATREQRNLLFQKMHDAGYEWDAEKKELKKIEQKPAWSEEDEDAIGMAIIALEDMYDEDEPNTTYGGYNLPFNKAAERLKSLRFQNTWKPSKEQMKALWDSIPENVKEISAREMLLDSLYQDLKKLSEE